MKRKVIIFSLIIALLFITPVSAILNHPRTLFDSSDIPNLKIKVSDGGRDNEAFDQIITEANLDLLSQNPGEWGASYAFKDVPITFAAYHLSDNSNPNKQLYRDLCKTAVLYLTNTENSRGDPFEASKRLYSLSLGYDMCFDSATQIEKDTVITEIEEYLSWITGGWEYGTPWNTQYTPYLNPPSTFNKGIMVGSMLGLASISIRGDSSNDALLDNAMEMSDAILNANLDTSFGTDGAYSEGVLYGMWSMRFLIPYIEARKRYDGFDYGSLDQIKNMQNWLVYGIRPSRYSYINNLNDADSTFFPLVIHSTYLDWAQTKYNSKIMKWLWEKVNTEHRAGGNIVLADKVSTALWGEELIPINPGDILPRSKLFSHRGLYYYRNGWPDVDQINTDHTVFSLYSGKFWGGHAQEDQGQFTLFSKGEDFIRDSGSENILDPINPKETQAHNLIVIDNQEQHKAGSVIGTDGEIKSYITSSFADFIHTNNTNAYNTHSEFNDNDNPFPHGTEPDPILNSERLALVVKPEANSGEYFVIFDDINKDNNIHTYDYFIHSKENNVFDYSSNPVKIVGGEGLGILDIYFVNPNFEDIGFSDENFTVSKGDGNNRRMTMSINTINPNYFYIMFPRLLGDVIPKYNKINVNNGYGVRIDFEQYSDLIFYNSGDLNLKYNNLETNSRVSTFRSKSELLPEKFIIGEGTYLKNIIPLVEIYDGKSSVSYSGTDYNEITIGDPNLSYLIYGPDVTKVTYEGNNVPFTANSNYILVNYIPPSDFPTVTLSSNPNMFSCSSIDDNGIKNLSLYIKKENNPWTKIHSVDSETLNYRTTNLEYGSYKINCLAVDLDNQKSFSKNSKSITLNKPSIKDSTKIFFRGSSRSPSYGFFYSFIKFFKNIFSYIHQN